ncbi:SGNH/GDSL hydrolase family protein [Blastococcus sp. CT_GayMR20]|uniref:SGNH/GDSL hydrolase family protein n=1 Tax=Blastococcus sp. CT_GayMR20 TaxID=2559609 RepID=UPI001072FBCF|nr:GDSL-type esterase/lipase family protein [Blastococcus sp. CT_GayMR20]TFV81321.1 SGNH/GDSL hydrolase family protein [Blastococcus sp. CT_GayMR20]TFV81330.1 SGNH/GDSL hydrolase family protein [Blastococcus sp. CT_GayMR20]
MRTSSTARFRRLTVGLVTATCLVATASCSAGGGSSAAESSSSVAAPTTEPSAGTYMALGDSVPFGFRGGATAEFSDADNFVGYPELVAEELGVDVINASCPGETTASFVDTKAQSNGCDNSLRSGFGYRTAYPLHVLYDTLDQSQLDFALSTLEDTEVELVTVQIGANDAFICQQTTAARCSSPAELQALAQTVQTNLDGILKRLREQYDGQVVVVTYYALDYSDAFGVATGVLGDGIAQIAEANGADVADGYEAFRARATAAGGSSVEAGLVLPNDVHPSEEGQRLLADAVLSVVKN